MSRLCLAAFLAFLCATPPAASKFTGQHHPPPPPPTKHCTVQHNHNGTDDSAHILKAFKDCATDSVITFLPANYSAYTPITLAGLNNVIIHLNGNLLLPNNITKVQQEINVTTNQPSTYATPWFYFHGSNVQLIGSADFEWGRFYGFGNHWWDLGNRTLRPQLATFNVTNGLMRNLKVIKPVAWGWNLPGTNLRVENHYVDAAPDNGTRWNTVSFPFNTRFTVPNFMQVSTSPGKTSPWTGTGFLLPIGVQHTHLFQILRPQWRRLHLCDQWSAKRLRDQRLLRILFSWPEYRVFGKRRLFPDCARSSVQKLDYGRSSLRREGNFKSWTGGAGFADNVTWEDITLVNVSTAIFLTQNYFDQSLGPPPNITSNSSTHISNFKYNNFKGGLNANWTDGTCITPVCWNFVQGGDATQSIIFDLYPGTAINISVGKIDVHPFEKPANETTVICDPATLAPGEQSTLGFNCTRGPYVPTPIV
ncbi:Glycoside hydrolase family 28 protein [Mycena venus]|uniref:galacturonan 1,4-alpha-galacturonidase n=1 Tax=Mycena venus TaxID=2733690 RepID=A0A8H6XNL5_9AGAR|nr:Glycoside hydrolase family 28 protein [Mycena venus]